MNEKDKISIIIPVYNVEAYVDECIDSVIHQTYPNLEIIIVDDGSKDQSGRKCDEWAKRDERIRVVHQKNGGLSDARNTGMSVATGKYIGFVDADDVIFPDMYAKLYRILQEGHAQISCCDCKKAISFDLEKEQASEKISVKQMNTIEAMKALILEEIQVTVWNKLYSRAVVEGVFFQKGRYHEDEFWMYQIIDRADKIVSTNLELYGYRQRENSIMTQAYSLKHLDLLDARVNRYNFLESKYPELAMHAKCNLCFECIRAYQLSCLKLSKDEKEIGKKKAMGIAKQYPVRYRDYKNLPIGRRVWCFLSRLSFPTTCYIRNRFHFGP